MSDDLDRMPWRHPFRMVDRVLDCTPRESIHTQKQVTANDPVMTAGTAPCRFFPAVLLLEGLSQTAAILYRSTYPDVEDRDLPMLGYLDASLHGSARPGEVVDFHVSASKMTRRGGVFRAEARVAEAVVAEVELAFSLAAPDTRSGGGPAS